MSLKYCLILCLYLLAIVVSARAQEGFPLPPLEVITPENAGEIVQVARIGNGVINEMAWSPNGITLGIASSLGVWLYDTDQPDAPPRLFEGQSGAQSLAFNPNGRYIASGGVDGSVWIWDIETDTQIARLEGFLYPVSAVTYSDDGSLLAAGDKSGVVRVWSTVTYQETYVIESLDEVMALAIDSLNAELAIGGRSALRIWSLPALKAQTVRTLSNGGDYGLRYLNGELVLVPLDNLPPEELGFRYGRVSFVSFGADKQVLVGVEYTADNWLWIWNLEQGESRQQIRTNRLAMNRDNISPDNRLIAVASDTGVSTLYNLITGDEYARLFGHRRGVNNITFSPDSALVASAGLDNLVGVWDIRAGGEIAPLIMLEGHTLGATAVAFSPDGTLIASGSYDGTIRLWGIPAES